MTLLSARLAQHTKINIFYLQFMGSIMVEKTVLSHYITVFNQTLVKQIATSEGAIIRTCLVQLVLPDRESGWQIPSAPFNMYSIGSQAFLEQ